MNRLKQFMKRKKLSILLDKNSGIILKSSVLSMGLDFMNMIIKVQDGEQKDILPVDIENKKAVLMKAVINYINHSIQLTDVT